MVSVCPFALNASGLSLSAFLILFSSWLSELAVIALTNALHLAVLVLSLPSAQLLLLSNVIVMVLPLVMSDSFMVSGDMVAPAAYVTAGNSASTSKAAIMAALNRMR
jgi:type IV secretory pathway component VirB8